MTKATLNTRRDGKVSLTLASNGHDIIRIPDSNIAPYSIGSQRARAWQVVSLMDGLSVQQGNDILAKLEYSIQRANGRPLGWIADAVSDGHAEIHKGEKPLHKRTKSCPAPGCDREFEGNGWDGLVTHWRDEHTDVCSYDDLWHVLQSIEANAQPARQRTIIVHECKQCGETFNGVRQALFCSNKCRYDAANERRKTG